MTLAVENLVVGDVVDIKFGDRIPADIRVLSSAGFKVLMLLGSHMYMYMHAYCAHTCISPTKYTFSVFVSKCTQSASYIAIAVSPKYSD